jgi:phosphoglycolate phosphatase-like HAD superfamily hydrolase
MKLVVFDIDGTLTQTSLIDELCFQRTYAELLEVHDLSAILETCLHISDTGLTRHVYQTRFGRAPHAYEEVAICERVVYWLREHHRLDPVHFAEVSGAVTMLERLGEKRDWVIAVATGCWQASAAMKLGAANIALHQKPAGFAEDGPARESIVSAAIDRASRHYNCTSFDKIVSVGDGVWDVRTAINLRLPFIGIGTGARAEALKSQGAQHIIPDFDDCQRFFDYLEQAEAPLTSLAASR